MKKEVKIEASWKRELAGEFEKAYFSDLTEFVRGEYAAGVVYPPAKLIFHAFDLLDLFLQDSGFPSPS